MSELCLVDFQGQRGGADVNMSDPILFCCAFIVRDYFQEIFHTWLDGVWQKFDSWWWFCLSAQLLVWFRDSFLPPKSHLIHMDCLWSLKQIEIKDTVTQISEVRITDLWVSLLLMLFETVSFRWKT